MRSLLLKIAEDGSITEAALMADSDQDERILKEILRVILAGKASAQGQTNEG